MKRREDKEEEWGARKNSKVMECVKIGDSKMLFSHLFSTTSLLYNFLSALYCLCKRAKKQRRKKKERRKKMKLILNSIFYVPLRIFKETENRRKVNQ